MTLVQVLADENSIHMSCDFCLTNPFTGATVKNDAHKLVQFGMPGAQGFVGVSGIAEFTGVPIGDWIATRTAELGPGATLDDLLSALLEAREPLLAISDRIVRRHSFVIAASIGTQSTVIFVSNFESLDRGTIRRASAAQDQLTISRTNPKAPAFFSTGSGSAYIDGADIQGLLLAVRSGRPDERIQQMMADANKAVSRQTATVSEGCYTASRHSTGQGSARPHLTDKQTGDFIPPDQAEMFRRLGVQLRPKLDEAGNPLPIRLVQSSFVSMGGSREYFREQLKLQPESSDLWNNYGSFLLSKDEQREAVEAFRRSVELNPANVTAKANLARQLWLQDANVRDADQLYVEAIAESEPTVPAWILSDYATFCAEGAGDDARATEFHERALLDPNFYPVAAARYSYFLFDRGQDMSRADQLLQEALGSQPRNAEIQHLAGLITWSFRSDSEAARAHFLEACALDTRNLPALSWAAQVSLSLGDGVTATRLYQRLAKRMVFTADMELNFGLALLLAYKFDGALRHLAKARKKFPENLGIATNLAATLFCLGRRQEAVESIRHLLVIRR